MRETAQQLRPRPTVAARVTRQVHDFVDDVFAVADHERVDELRHRLGAEGLCAAGDHQRMARVAFERTQWQPSQVQHRQHVRVLQFVLKGESDDVEFCGRDVAVEREQRNVEAPHFRFGVRPRRERQLGGGVRALVQDVMDDADAEIRQPDLVGIRERQQYPNFRLIQRLAGHMQRVAEVSIGLRYPG